MKTYEIDGKDINVVCAVASPAGHGHYEITVDLMDAVETKSFTAKTSDMHGMDAATDLDGQERYEALYELIASKIEGQVVEWLL